MIDLLEQKKIYDQIYATVDNYNLNDEIKNAYVDAFAKSIKGRILDAGCGEGIHLKRLLREGYDVFGIEISGVCCKQFLQNTPHENTDILTYSKKGVKYSGMICMDVLEHIDPLHIEETIHALSLLSPVAFFGIANHSDVINGIELHLIRENSVWWVNLLTKYYKRCYVISELAYQANRKVFFTIYCDGGEDNNLPSRQPQNQFETLLNNLRIVDQKVIDRLEQQLDLRLEHIDSLEQQLDLRLEHIDSLEQQIEGYKMDISAILQSNSWRITAPIRWIHRYILKLLLRQLNT